MARLTARQKAQRLLLLLQGLGNPEIMRALQPYGFDQATLDEGWNLLRQTSAARLDAASAAPPTRAEVQRLDAWENRWFPIAAAVLEHHHPEVKDRVFHNLRQTRRNQVVLSVTTFLDRVDRLARGDGSAALATLARHGLTRAVLDEARSLLGHVMRPPFPESADAGADSEPVAASAAGAMWSYYRLWSAIARSAISDRRLLRQLGFLRPQHDGNAGQDAGQDDGPDSAGPNDETGDAAA
jgi:hypothetical protein